VEGHAVSFCPSDLTAPNKSHRPPLCHPERTRISYLTALPAATYAALRKESRMTSTEATAFDRKSGGAEGPAVRPGSRTKVSLPLFSHRIVIPSAAPRSSTFPSSIRAPIGASLRLHRSLLGTNAHVAAKLVNPFAIRIP
jgi:hypothetical protein